MFIISNVESHGVPVNSDGCLVLGRKTVPWVASPNLSILHLVFLPLQMHGVSLVFKLLMYVVLLIYVYIFNLNNILKHFYLHDIFFATPRF